MSNGIGPLSGIATEIQNIYNIAVRWQKHDELYGVAARIMTAIVLRQPDDMFDVNLGPLINRYLLPAVKNTKRQGDALACILRVLRGKYVRPAQIRFRSREDGCREFVQIVFGDIDNLQEVDVGKCTEVKMDHERNMYSFVTRTDEDVTKIGERLQWINNAIFAKKQSLAEEHVQLYSGIIVQMAAASVEFVMLQTFPHMFVMNQKNTVRYWVGLRALRTILDRRSGFFDNAKNVAQNRLDPARFNEKIDDLSKAMSTYIDDLTGFCDGQVGLRNLGTTKIPYKFVRWDEELDEEDDDDEEFEVEEQNESSEEQEETEPTAPVESAAEELKKILTLWEDATLDTASYGSSSDHAKELEKEQEIVLKIMKQYGGPVPIPEQIEPVERKPEVILLLNIYAEVMLCAAVALPPENLGKPESPNFMGRMLIHPEQSLARACSFSLQRILLEAEDHRLSIIRGVAHLLNLEEYREVSTLLTVMDNLAAFLGMWKDLFPEGTHLPFSISTLPDWIVTLESHAISYLAHFSPRVRASALRILDRLRQLIHFDAFADENENLECGEIIHRFQDEIIQKAGFRAVSVAVRDGEKLFLTDEFRGKTFAELAENEEKILLWSYCLQELAHFLSEKMSLDVLTASCKMLIQKIENLPEPPMRQGDVAKVYGLYTYAYAFLWTNTASLAVGMSGPSLASERLCAGHEESEEDEDQPNPVRDILGDDHPPTPSHAIESPSHSRRVTFEDDTDMDDNIRRARKRLHFMKGHQAELRPLFSKLWPCLLSEIPFVRWGVRFVTGGVHWFSSRVVCTSLLGWWNTEFSSAKKKKKIPLLEIATEVAEIFRTLSTNTTFPLAIESAFRDNVKPILQFIHNTLDHCAAFVPSTAKSVQQIESAIALMNFVPSLVLTMSSSLIESKQDPEQDDAGKLIGFGVDSRRKVLLYLQKMSGIGEESENYLTMFKNQVTSLVSKEKDPEVKRRAMKNNETMIKKLSKLSISAIEKVLELGECISMENVVDEIRWYIDAQVSGVNVISSLLYFHFDALFDQFLKLSFSRRNVQISDTFFMSICDLFLPHRDLMTKPPGTGVLNDTQEFFKQLSRQRVIAGGGYYLSFDRPYPSWKLNGKDKIEDYGGHLMFLCLWQLVNPSLKVHSRAHEFLCALARVNFGSSIDLGGPKGSKDGDDLFRLMEHFRTAFNSGFLDSVRRHGIMMSRLLSQNCHGLTGVVFEEALTRLLEENISEEDARLAVQLLLPWCANISLSNETLFEKYKDRPSNEQPFDPTRSQAILDLIFQVSSSFLQSGYLGEIKKVWQSISEALADPTNDSSGEVNLSVVVDFIVEKATENDENVNIGKDLLAHLYRFHAESVVLPLVYELTIDKYKKVVDVPLEKKRIKQVQVHVDSADGSGPGSSHEDPVGLSEQMVLKEEVIPKKEAKQLRRKKIAENLAELKKRRDFVIRCLGDLACEMNNFAAVMKHLPTILFFGVVHMSPIDHSPDDHIRLMMRHMLIGYASQCEDEKVSSDLRILAMHLQNPDFILLWPRPSATESVTEMLLDEAGVKVDDEDIDSMHSMLPFYSSKMDAMEFMKKIVIGLKQQSSNLVDLFGYQALEWGIQSLDNSISLKSLQTYRAVLRPFNSRRMYVLVEFLMKCLRSVEHGYRKKRQSRSSMMKRFLWRIMALGRQESYAPKLLQSIEIINILNELAKDLSKRQKLQELKAFLWVAVSLTRSPLRVIYTSALRLLDTIVSDPIVFEYLINRIDQAAVYTKGWTPSFRGIQPQIIHGFVSEEDEDVAVRVLVSLAQSSCVEMVHNSEGRFMVTILMLLPYLYNELAKDNQSVRMGKARHACSEIATGLEHAAISDRQLIKELQNYADGLATNASEFLVRVCERLVEMYFPTHFNLCVETLNALFSESNDENKLVVLRIIHALLSNRKSRPDLLLPLSGMIRFAGEHLTDRTMSAVCAGVVAASNEMAFERGDHSTVFPASEGLHGDIPSREQRDLRLSIQALKIVMQVESEKLSGEEFTVPAHSPHMARTIAAKTAMARRIRMQSKSDLELPRPAAERPVVVSAPSSVVSDDVVFPVSSGTVKPERSAPPRHQQPPQRRRVETLEDEDSKDEIDEDEIAEEGNVEKKPAPSSQKKEAQRKKHEPEKDASPSKKDDEKKKHEQEEEDMDEEVPRLDTDRLSPLSFEDDEESSLRKDAGSSHTSPRSTTSTSGTPLAALGVVHHNGIEDSEITPPGRQAAKRTPPQRNEEVEIVLDDDEDEDEESLHGTGSAVGLSPGLKRPPTLSEVLHDDRMRQHFKRFVENEFDEDGLNFYLAVRRYVQERVVLRAALQARMIVQRFISVDSFDTINISDLTRSEILTTFKTNPKSPPRTLFHRAMEEVKQQMQNEIFPFFLESTEYDKMLEMMSPRHRR
eukprot:TRINITY_DN1283_c0_g1_i3.p1 TRINITY_DN1283_c0_g1~~TRINITY_DN1283_c0_g1_i3.p1  ORF type:complete len:2401 (+),score=684.30 TRINITY_DN1283_c0_g1_i3:1082-8284(+)